MDVEFVLNLQHPPKKKNLLPVNDNASAFNLTTDSDIIKMSAQQVTPLSGGIGLAGSRKLIGWP